MTYYLILGLALAVAGLGCLARRHSPGLSQGMIVCGCVGLVACVGWQVRQNMFSPAANGPDRGQAVVGYFLANHVLNEVGEKDGAILLFFPPERVIDQETAGTYAGTFARVLRGFPGLKVQTLTLGAPTKSAKAGKLPLSSFQQAASGAPPAVAYVSFAGVPFDIENFRSGSQQAGPRWFVFDPWATTNWLGALSKGRVRCVIVPRPGVRHAPGEEISGEPNEVFDQLYLLATPDTADQVAAKMGVK